MKIIVSTCHVCGGRGFTKKGHQTNKRNKKKCIRCEGKGEYTKQIH